MRTACGVAGVVAVIGLAACGGSDVQPADGDEKMMTVDDSSESPTASDEAETELPSDEDVLAFFEAMSSNDPSNMEQVKGSVEPGSIAAAYLGYYTAISNAAIDGGYSSEPESVTKTDEGYETCFDGPQGQRECSLWGDIEGRDGKIVDFTVDGQEIGPRMSTGDGKSIEAGDLAELTFLYAYKSIQSGALFVCSEIESKATAINIELHGATYHDPTGRQSKSVDGVGPTDLAPDSRATICPIFASAIPGGDVTIKVVEQSGAYREGSATLKTR